MTKEVKDVMFGNKVLVAAIALSMSCMVSWAVWVTVALFGRPDWAQVKQIIAVEAPYVQDRSSLDLRIKRLELEVSKERDDVRRVIERNTEAINNLKVEITKLSNR